MAYLYRHIRLDKNIPFYVGIGSDADGQHKRAFSRNGRKEKNIHWYNVATKHGYRIEIILDDLTWQDACKKEIEFIRLYGRKDLNEGALVNKTDGGEGTVGVIRSVEIIEKFKAVVKDKYKNGYVNPNKGKKFTAERVEQMSKITAARTGELSARKKPVVQFSLTGEMLCEYFSCRKANEITGISYSTISCAALGKTFSAGGYIWIFKRENNDKLLMNKVYQNSATRRREALRMGQIKG